MENYEEFKGDLTCPVTVKLNDEFKSAMAKCSRKQTKMTMQRMTDA